MNLRPPTAKLSPTWIYISLAILMWTYFSQLEKAVSFECLLTLRNRFTASAIFRILSYVMWEFNSKWNYINNRSPTMFKCIFVAKNMRLVLLTSSNPPLIVECVCEFGWHGHLLDSQWDNLHLVRDLYKCDTCVSAMMAAKGRQ